MKIKIYLIIAFALISFALPQTDTESSEFADENNPGFVTKLIDFNLLGRGNRFEQPFHIENWLANLDGAIDYAYNRNLTYVKIAKDNSDRTSLGFRINFPRVKINAYGILKPVFGIPFLRDRYEFKGFVDNVGAIRSIRVRIRSNIFPYRVIVVLQDKQGNISEHRFNRRLNFYGWEELEWKNTQYSDRYIYNPEDKKEPIYPLIVPGVRLHSIKFERDRGIKIKGGYDPRGTDFVAYISDIEMTYDKAVNDQYFITEAEKQSPDYIDNEKTFQIEAEIEKEIVDTQVNKAFNEYRLNVLLQRARKRLETPGMKFDSPIAPNGATEEAAVPQEQADDAPAQPAAPAGQ